MDGLFENKLGKQVHFCLIMDTGSWTTHAKEEHIFFFQSRERSASSLREFYLPTRTCEWLASSLALNCGKRHPRLISSTRVALLFGTVTRRGCLNARNMQVLGTAIIPNLETFLLPAVRSVIFSMKIILGNNSSWHWSQTYLHGLPSRCSLCHRQLSRGIQFVTYWNYGTQECFSLPRVLMNTGEWRAVAHKPPAHIYPISSHFFLFI